LGEGRENDIADDAGNLSDRAEAERGERDQHEDRHQQRDGDKEAEQQLDGGAGVFRAVPADLGIGPEEAPDVGDEPEPVDTECQHLEEGAPDHQATECPHLTGETPAHGGGRAQFGGWRNSRELVHDRLFGLAGNILVAGAPGRFKNGRRSLEPKTSAEVPLPRLQP